MPINRYPSSNSTTFTFDQRLIGLKWPICTYVYVTQTTTDKHQHFNQSQTRVRNTCSTVVWFDVGINIKLPIWTQIFKLIFYDFINQNVALITDVKCNTIKRLVAIITNVGRCRYLYLVQYIMYLKLLFCLQSTPTRKRTIFRIINKKTNTLGTYLVLISVVLINKLNTANFTRILLHNLPFGMILLEI